MFPLQRSEDLLFQIFSNPNIPSQQTKISQDLFFDHNTNNSCSYVPVDVAAGNTYCHNYTAVPATVTPNSSRKRQQRDGVFATCADDFVPPAAAPADTATDDNNKLKRIMHREIERQRRQEMATLYASLRSLLPLEYVKGKRSTSDHMHEALNYIKQMQKNVQELERKRNRLKAAAAAVSPPPPPTSSSQVLEKHGSTIRTDRSPNFVSVSLCRGGVEILINCSGGGSGKKSWCPLSRVVRSLQNEGFDVVSCDSTMADNRLLHRLQSEGCDEKHIGVVALQQKLNEVIKYLGKRRGCSDVFGC